MFLLDQLNKLLVQFVFIQILPFQGRFFAFSPQAPRLGKVLELFGYLVVAIVSRSVAAVTFLALLTASNLPSFLNDCIDIG